MIVEILSREDVSDENAPDHFFEDLAQFNKVALSTHKFYTFQYTILYLGANI